MKRGSMGLMAALLLAAPLAAKVPMPAPTPDSALVEGQVIPSVPEAVIGGWRKLWTGDHVTRTMAGRVTTESLQCCIAVFGKGNALLVLKTEALTRDAKGEPLTERIQRKLWITQRRGEQVADCQILWINPALSLVDIKSNAVRSVVVEDGQLVIFNWQDSGNCAYGD